MANFFEPENRAVRLRVIVITCLCLLLLAIAFVSAIVVTSKSYFDKHYEMQNPAWVTEIFLEGRLLLGRFRQAPSNDEMIRFYQAHQEEIDRLINDYYTQLRIFYEATPPKRQFPDINAKLQVQMASLGIMKINAAGPYYANSMYGKNTFQRMGVHFLPIDRAGLSGASGQARLYVYVPRVSDQGSLRESPISWHFGSGEYGPSNSIPAFCSRHDYQCCGLQIFTDNWAIANCIHSEIKY